VKTAPVKAVVSPTAGMTPREVSKEIDKLRREVGQFEDEVFKKETRLKVIEITEEHRRITAIIGKTNRLEVPAIAKERVLAAISAVSSIVTVHSDIGGGISNAEEVPADSKPHMHLLPAGEGLKLAVLARPFTDAGSYYRPGTGGATVMTEIEGKRLQTTRNLKEEKKEYVLSKQLLRCGTSIGANIAEANGGISDNDFSAKMSIAYKECLETKYWLSLLKDTNYIRLVPI